MLQHSVLEGVCIGEETWVFVVLCLPFCASLYVVGLVLRGLQEEWCVCGGWGDCVEGYLVASAASR